MSETKPHNKRALGYKHSLETKLFISECMKGNKNTLGRNHTEEEKKKISLVHKGKVVSIETRKKLSESHKGKIPWNKGIPQSKEMRDKITGENHPNWKGGVTPVNYKIRNSIEYKNWRKAVFERDKYTCKECGGSGITLNADHIKPFALYPELRLVIDNGRTLCVPCHKKTSTYGYSKMNKEQLLEFSHKSNG